VSAREDALVEIVELMRRHGLTVDEVSAALTGSREFQATRSGAVLSRFFSYLGGVFVFAGLVIFVGMQWDELASFGRVLATLGAGFVVFLAGVFCTTDDRFARAATPLLLVAAALQPTGIVVALEEYSSGGEPARGLLFMNGLMAIQQGCTFWARRRTVLALTTTAFATGFFVVGLDLLGVDHHLIGVVVGTSLLCVAWSLHRSPHAAGAGLVYLVGAATLLGAAFDALRDTAFEPAFAGLAAAVVFVSAVARSRSLLVAGTLALIAYLGRFITEHFADTLGAPLVLILIGVVLMGLGMLAVRIHRTYIRERGAA
jgi:hypothetical protein